MNRTRNIGRVLTLALAVFGLVAGLAGCSGGSNTAPPAVSANAPADPASTAAGGSGMPTPTPPK
ncbi:MAG: hypothetical protein ACO1SX_01255 [Actinomycetota bacterium]